MNFERDVSAKLARGWTETAAFATASSLLAPANTLLRSIKMSPEVEMEPYLARSGANPTPKWLNALTELLRRAAASRAIVYAVFTVIYLVPTLWLAKYKLMWDDEFFTLYLSRGGWQSILAGLATGADQHPPPFYYLTHLLFQLFGMSHITLRLPAIAGFWILCVCLYEIVRRLTIPMWGVVAMLLPLSTQIYYYATEARGYGLVTGFSAMAVLALMAGASQSDRASLASSLSANAGTKPCRCGFKPLLRCAHSDLAYGRRNNADEGARQD